MSAIDKAAQALTKCHKCLGCIRQEDDNFRGDNSCKNYRENTQKPVEYDTERYDNWRPPK
jgi:hypothetical protein